MRAYTKFSAIIITLILLHSCETPKYLYDWRGYDDAFYNYTQKKDEASKDKLIRVYENLISNPGGTSKKVPPGVFADYGFLLISSGNKERGIDMLHKEIELYPESRVFIERIIKRAKNEN